MIASAYTSDRDYEDATLVATPAFSGETPDLAHEIYSF
jgi:hypothetical protein